MSALDSNFNVAGGAFKVDPVSFISIRQGLEPTSFEQRGTSL